VIFNRLNLFDEEACFFVLGCCGITK